MTPRHRHGAAVGPRGMLRRCVAGFRKRAEHPASVAGRLVLVVAVAILLGGEAVRLDGGHFKK
ncbi:MAG: hypothetical protein EOR67_03665 [Mesorhizobium sp.]|uniref:hypothetical protein n=1 Tax=Mesorhizobium sp. TaxID=1871066 RepID=UPI000FE85209|nr:hypothetical protein [Mesorhizobium sp.]RWL83361.1 MAG: hypothetical protein EOR69_11325 [Mesorhizobium sp.]RWL90514.1 MAG: hypothetical protein EOR67_03665 [Mesorhizobium sp.]RWM00102.1 MAG: hypothetical protein EOR70_08895 [Mesorhizobium sp.]